jgi:hypothetical protein
MHDPQNWRKLPRSSFERLTNQVTIQCLDCGMITVAEPYIKVAEYNEATDGPLPKVGRRIQRLYGFNILGEQEITSTTMKGSKND